MTHSAIFAFVAALSMSAAVSCDPDDDAAGIPLSGGTPDTPYVYMVDEARVPDGVTLIAASDPLRFGRFFFGDVQPTAGEALIARSTNRDWNDSELHLLSKNALRQEDKFVLPEPHAANYAVFSVMQSQAGLLYTGKARGGSGMSAVFDVDDGMIDPVLISDGSGGGGRGRSILLAPDVLYTYAQTDSRTIHLVNLNPRTGDATYVTTHDAIDTTWNQELSGFALVRLGEQQLLTYFIRSYSEAISSSTYRFCAYDLTGDSLRYDLTPEALGLRPDQATSIFFGNVHDGVVAYQLGSQYAGLDPFTPKVLWTHDDIDGRLIFANAGEYPPNAEGIAVFPSNGAAPTCGIDVTTGEILWTNEELRPNGPMSLPLDDRYTLYCDINAVLHCVEARTGEIRWSMASPTVRNGRSRTNFVGYFALDGRDLYIHDPWRLYKFRISE